jgi:hypothetical protein
MTSPHTHPGSPPPRWIGPGGVEEISGVSGWAAVGRGPAAAAGPGRAQALEPEVSRTVSHAVTQPGLRLAASVSVTSRAWWRSGQMDGI